MGNLDLKSKYGDILKQHGVHDEILEVHEEIPKCLIGEHMGSICQFTTVKFKNESRENYNFFVKKPITMVLNNTKKDENGKSEMDGMMTNVMIKEGDFLTKIVPEYRRICNEKLGIDLIKNLFPKTYYADSSMIIMENLAPKGYTMMEKSQRQGFNQAKKVIEGLATMHGISHILLKESGTKEEFLKKYPMLLDLMDNPAAEEMMSGMFEPAFAVIVEMVRASKLAEGKTVLPTLQKYQGQLCKVMNKAVGSPTIFEVVNHGDCWNNNMMFSKDNELMFLDFQMTRVTSPCIDLGYFIFTSTNHEARSQWRDLLRVYYDKAQEITSKLGEKLTFSCDDFIKEFSEKADLGFLMGLLMTIGTEALKLMVNEENASSRGTLNPDVFRELLVKWIDANPEKVDDIVKSIVKVVATFDDIKSIQ